MVVGSHWKLSHLSSAYDPRRLLFQVSESDLRCLSEEVKVNINKNQCHLINPSNRIQLLYPQWLIGFVQSLISMHHARMRCLFSMYAA
jgi:hypothetical protein